MLSGTSRDGVDAALVSFASDTPQVLATRCDPYPPELRRRLEALLVPPRRPTPRAAFQLDRPLADHFAATARRLLADAAIDAPAVAAIGSHGQTVWHDPDREPPETLQLGDPRHIANGTGITTIGDFRRADIEAGGQGAPLAPLLHRVLFARPGALTREYLAGHRQRYTPPLRLYLVFSVLFFLNMRKYLREYRSQIASNTHIHGYILV